MKKCPFCAEEIQDAAVVCRFCGRDVPATDTKDASTTAPSPRPEPSPVKPAKTTKMETVTFVKGKDLTIATVCVLAGLGMSFLPFSGMLPLGMLLIFAGSVYALRGGCFLRLIAACLAMFIFSCPGTVIQISRGTREGMAQQARAEAVRIKQREDYEKALRAQQERLRQQAPQNYQSGVAALKAGQYDEAIRLLSLVQQGDPQYKDAPAQLAAARSAQAAAAEKVNAGEVAKLLADAKNLARSNNCGDKAKAVEQAQRAQKLSSRRQDVAVALRKAQEERLSCFEVMGSLQMAIRIEDKRPLLLTVWIKNNSPRVRHANPTYFTLITKDGQSHSYSPSTFSSSRPFNAVQLQPNTETYGMVAFDTSAEPKTLVYAELMGERIARDFP